METTLTDYDYYVYNHNTNGVEGYFLNEFDAEECASQFKNATVYPNDEKLKQMETSKIEFTRVKNDVNGNPRYVCHFLELISDMENEGITADCKRNGWDRLGTLYNTAMHKARKIGGRKFHNKQYGGGIVFQSYNIADLEKSILKLKNQ